MRDWYMPPPAKVNDEQSKPITWRQILDAWNELEADMHSVFGVDVESGVMAERTWRWFELRAVEIVTDASTRAAQKIAAEQ